MNLIVALFGEEKKMNTRTKSNFKKPKQFHIERDERGTQPDLIGLGL